MLLTSVNLFQSTFMYTTKNITFSSLSLPLLYVILVAIILGAIKRRYFSPLSKYPGPFLASITRWWIVFDAWKGKHHETMLSLHEKYGDIVRVTPYEVQISSPEAVHTIYGSATKGFRKGPWYNVWVSSIPKTVFTEDDNAAHSMRRRYTGQAYSLTSILHMEEHANTYIKKLLTKWKDHAEREKTVMLDEWVQWYAFDVVGELALGKEFGFIKEGRDLGWCSVLKDAVTFLSWVGFVPYMKTVLVNRFTTKIPALKRKAAAQMRFKKFAANAVLERFMEEGKTDRKDMLAYWLDQHHKKPNEWKKDHVLSEAVSAIFAGSDTTAIAIRAVFYYLLKNPETYRKLQQEIDELDSKGKIKDIVSYNDSTEMPYLLAVIKEAMRMWPSIAFAYQRLTPADGANIAGQWFPGSVIVGCNAFVIHRNKDVFGDDADIFRPQRWLESETKSKYMDRFMIQFGSGNRTCLGKNISLMEMQKLIPSVMLYFDLTLTHPEREWKTVNIDFNIQSDIEVTVRQRNEFRWSSLLGTKIK